MNCGATRTNNTNMQEKLRPKEDSSLYAKLKKELLNGEINFEDLIDKLLELDQSTLARSASEDNLKFLFSSEVTDYIQQRQELAEEYYHFVSFTEFHVAQIHALEDTYSATERFRNAFEAACMQSDKSWRAYTEGTLLYMEGKVIPQELIDAVEEPENVQILKNLNQGLVKRGHASYKQDYLGSADENMNPPPKADK